MSSVSGFSIGDISPLWVEEGSFSGLAAPAFVQMVGIISDGSSTDNEVMQSGSVPRPQAKGNLPWLTDAQEQYLRAIYESVTPVAFETPTESLTVVILDLPQPTYIGPGLWRIDGVTLVRD